MLAGIKHSGYFELNANVNMITMSMLTCLCMYCICQSVKVLTDNQKCCPPKSLGFIILIIPEHDLNCVLSEFYSV